MRTETQMKLNHVVNNHQIRSPVFSVSIMQQEKPFPISCSPKITQKCATERKNFTDANVNFSLATAHISIFWQQSYYSLGIQKSGVR